MANFSYKGGGRPSGSLDARRSPASAGPLVLIVEDDEDTRLMLRTILERRGIRVREARDGEAGVCAVAELHPDLVFMDGSLPRMDGRDATRRIREREDGHRIPLVFISGHVAPASQSEAFAAGCDDYLVKPIDFTKFYGVLERYLCREVRCVAMRNEPGASVMSVTTHTTHKFFGLLALDAGGTVLYSREEGDGDGDRPPDYLAGQNFYSGAAPFKNVEDFRRLLDRFAGGSEQASRFTFVCEYEDGDVPVRVLLAHIREPSDARRTKAILVHIKKAR